MSSFDNTSELSPSRSKQLGVQLSVVNVPVQGGTKCLTWTLRDAGAEPRTAVWRSGGGPVCGFRAGCTVGRVASRNVRCDVYLGCCLWDSTAPFRWLNFQNRAD
ncbi:hypothetical protein C8Q78DRAFT_1009443 [Trametes maxima]|nr:hypothetical protein C8Q78DRAFT_1009443 [Trametes maxima]